jgi:putative ABC transport system substrate-binding protein
MTVTIGRRELLATLGGAAAVAWPLAALAQQREKMRRIGVLMNLTADDLEASARVTALAQGLQQLGWTDGRNVRIDYRWGAIDADRSRRHAAELLAFAPDVILAVGGPAVMALQQGAVPIVFVNVSDPVGAGFVNSLARPGGNVTGFAPFEFSISAKWLELLKEIAPRVTRAAVIRDAAGPFGTAQFDVIQAAAPSFGVEVRPVGVRDAPEIEHAVTAFARSANGGLIVTAIPATAAHRKLIVALADRHRLPAVYSFRYYATSGGLISYGPDTNDPFRRAASLLIASSRARSRPIFRCSCRPSMSSSSTSRPRTCSASKCRRRCSPAPTR